MNYKTQSSASVPKTQKGVTALLTILIILSVILIIISGITLTILNNLKSGQNTELSLKSYYAAESGIEDILLRANPASGMQLPPVNPSVLNVENATATRNVGDIIGGTRIISSEGNLKNRIRKINAVYAVAAQQISFYYGAQVGDGGMEMANNSRVEGNVFSNGNITSSRGGDKGYVDNTIIVAKNGNRIEGLVVGGDASSHSCKDSQISGILTYVSGGSVENCDAGGSTQSQPNEILPKDLPISQQNIDDWKNDAAVGEPIVGDYTISGSRTVVYLGPKKIDGNFKIDNNATLIMKGALWITGDFTIDNGGTIKLDAGSYGATSGVIVADGKIKIKPGVTLKGTEQEGSYLMALTTNPEISDKTNPAIDINNTTQGAIFYSSQGLIVLRNRVKAREITGYKIYLDNNAEIDYETGLENALFSSGPGGGWEVKEWKETI